MYCPFHSVIWTKNINSNNINNINNNNINNINNINNNENIRNKKKEEDEVPLLDNLMDSFGKRNRNYHLIKNSQNIHIYKYKIWKNIQKIIQKFFYY